MNPENKPIEPMQSVPVPTITSEQTVQTPEITPVPAPKKRISLVGVLIVFLILFLLVGGGGVSAALIAYDKVTLPNSDIQLAVKEAVLSLPFTPKTAGYVLEKSAIAANSVTSATLDASIAISGSALLPVAGSNNLDIALTGSFDKSDTSNIKSQFTVKAGSLFAADMKTLNKKVYFKINTFPTKLITPFLPLSEEMVTSELSHWIVWDSGSLDTEARALVEKNTQNQNKTSQETLMEILKNKTLMSKMTLSTENLDGVEMYKLHPTVDAEFVKAYITEFGTEAQKQNVDTSKWLDSVKNFNLDMFIAKNNYQVARVTVSFSTKEDSTLISPLASVVPGASSGDMQVAAVLKISDYNRPLTVEVPTDIKDWKDVFNDFTSALMATQSATLLNPGNQFAKARDAQRHADLLGITNMVYEYAAEHNGNLPQSGEKAFPTKATCIGTSSACFDLAHAGVTGSVIVPTYVSAMMKDPQNGTDADTKYTIYIDANGRLQAQANSEQNPTSPIIVTR